MSGPTLISVRKAAEILDVAPKTVYGMIYEGILPFVRVGKRGGDLRIRYDALTKWIAQNTEQYGVAMDAKRVAMQGQTRKD